MMLPGRLFLPALILLFQGIFAQDFDSICLQQQHVLRTIATHHYRPPVFDAATNAQVLDLYLKEADEKGIIFQSADRESLLETIQAAGNSTGVYCELIRQSYTIFNRRLQQLDSILRIVETSRLDFSPGDSISFSFRRKDRVFPASLTQVRARIDKRLKYESLVDITSPAGNQRELLNPEYGELSAVKEKSRHKSIRRLRRHLAPFNEPGQLSRYLGDCMSNAISQRSDPHTNYFNTRQIESYNKALFMEERSFGFSVTQDDNGNILISELEPGGPAWKSNGLNEKDLILSFRFENQPEVHVDNTGLEDFHESFHQSGAEVVELKVLKKDLKVKVVRLKKEKIRSQENMMNSYLVHAGKRKIGYIPIPSFYLDQEGDSRQGCANDVAKEIIELKQDSISGLILDLRYNGGGSMREAMALAGIFINEGPVAVYQPKDAKPFLLKDLNRGSIWDGPLVILVNGASASASEFVTATLQDYNRAVVVGSSTFGKGTAQSVIMADSGFYQRADSGSKPVFGFMKITSGKFYRLSNKSHQGKGIEPDVVIPGIIEQVMEKESGALYAFAPDTIEKPAAFEQLRPLPREQLRGRSTARISASQRFRRILAIGDSLQFHRKRPERVALTVPDFMAYTERQANFNRQVEALFTIDDSSSFSITGNSENQKIIAMSGHQEKNHAEAVNALKRDLILHESILILCDLIELSKAP